MANTIHVDVVSAEEQIYSGEAEFVVLPGVVGELGIYPRHTPLLTQIKPGAVRIKIPGTAEEELVFVQGGYLEVQPHLVTVLADTAIRAKDLDEKAALDLMMNDAFQEEGEAVGKWKRARLTSARPVTAKAPSSMPSRKRAGTAPPA